MDRVKQLGSELTETVGFAAGVGLFGWGLFNPDEALLWTFVALWPVASFLPLAGPRYFRNFLIVAGVLIVIVYGIVFGVASATGIRYVAGGAGLMVAGLFITPRTQRALVILRLALASIIVGYYAYLLVIEQGFAGAAALFTAPVALLLIYGFVKRSRSFWRAGAAGRWHQRQTVAPTAAERSPA